MQFKNRDMATRHKEQEPLLGDLDTRSKCHEMLTYVQGAREGHGDLRTRTKSRDMVHEHKKQEP